IGGHGCRRRSEHARNDGKNRPKESAEILRCDAHVSVLDALSCQPPSSHALSKFTPKNVATPVSEIKANAANIISVLSCMIPPKMIDANPGRSACAPTTNSLTTAPTSARLADTRSPARKYGNAMG